MLQNSIHQAQLAPQDFVSGARSTRQINAKVGQRTTYRLCIMPCMGGEAKAGLSRNVREPFDWSLSREESYQLKSVCLLQEFEHSSCIRHYMLMQLSIIWASYSILVSRRLSVRYAPRRCMIIESRQLLQPELRTLPRTNAPRPPRCLPENEIDVLSPRRQSTTLLHSIGAAEQTSKARFRLRRGKHRETPFAEFSSPVVSSQNKAFRRQVITAMKQSPARQTYEKPEWSQFQEPFSSLIV